MPATQKRFKKVVTSPSGRKRTIRYGQKGATIKPGTPKGDAYCARSAKIKKCKNPPCPNDLSRKKWKCRGTKSMS